MLGSTHSYSLLSAFCLFDHSKHSEVPCIIFFQARFVLASCISEQERKVLKICQSGRSQSVCFWLCFRASGEADVFASSMSFTRKQHSTGLQEEQGQCRPPSTGITTVQTLGESPALPSNPKTKP